jgi:hypothetical protein
MALLCPILSMSQNPISFKWCTNCPVGENTSNIDSSYIYGDLTQYQSSDVTSDFGARYPSPRFDWHKGVDYRPHGCHGMDGCRGTSVVAIQGGTVNRIYAAHGMKMIAIEGDDGEHYGYGHIFNSRFIGQNSTHRHINEGKFFIKHLEEDAEVFAIVDLTNDVAFGPVEGTVTIDVGNNQRSIRVLQNVDPNQDIAPMGGSCCSFYRGQGAENDALPVHLHLYQFRNINAINLVSEAYETNCMNPLHNIVHESPQIEVKWQTQGQSTWSEPVINSDGTKSTNFRVRPLMLNVTNPAGQTISETGRSNRYGNVVSNMNSVAIEIKKSTDSSFRPYYGKDYLGIINLGGTSETRLYPHILTNDNRFGQWGRQGINAFAYDDHNGYPYDDYYFADFYTRIHKDSIILFSDSPKNTRYNDGRYKLKPTVTNVRDELFTTTAINFTIDNFMPFITEINVELNNDFIYGEKRDQCEGADNTLNDGFLTRHPEIGHAQQTFGAISQLVVKIETSEPMSQMTFQIAHFVLQFPVVAMNATNQDSTEWEASFSHTNLRQLEQCAHLIFKHAIIMEY